MHTYPILPAVRNFLLLLRVGSFRQSVLSLYLRLFPSCHEAQPGTERGTSIFCQDSMLIHPTHPHEDHWCKHEAAMSVLGVYVCVCVRAGGRTDGRTEGFR